MFVRTDAELERIGRVKFPMGNQDFRSARFLTAADGMGFSYHENRGRRGIDFTIWLRNHWEANYIASGKGEVVDLTSGEAFPLAAGVLYVVGPNDRHRFRITEDMHSISIFCPPLTGNETVDAQGGYPASVPIEKTDRRMFVKRGSDLRKAGQEMVVANGQARTLRMLTKADGLGFGFSDVHFDKGAEAQLWYKHHWEANHILSGTGEVTDLTTGESWALGPGIAYNVGPKDRHVVKANSDLHYISVFCPPLIGTEQHDKDGALSPSGPVPPGPAGY
ncbi:MAG: ectoine synthase [Hyphomicrobiaceae bacterium]